MQRWFIDGSTQCFQKGHVALGLLAIAVLVLCVTTIVIVVLYSFQWLQVSTVLQAMVLL